MRLFRSRSARPESWFQIQDAPGEVLASSEQEERRSASGGGLVSVEVTIRDGSRGGDQRLAVDAPPDVPLGEMLPDFLDAAGEHAQRTGRRFIESDGWTLVLPDGRPAEGTTLRDLGVRSLALYDALRADPPFPAPDDAEQAPTGARRRARVPVDQSRGAGRARDRGHRAPADGAGRPPRRRDAGGSAGRPVAPARVVRSRCEQSLPARLGPLARVAETLRSLSSRCDVREAEAFGLEDPGRFVRENRRSVLRRMREVWWSTDYERLLEASILMPCPERCQTVACISPKGGVGKTTVSGLLATLLSFVRRGVTIAVDANPDMSNLGAKLAPGRGTLIDELLTAVLASDAPSPMDVLAWLGQGPDGVYVAPSPNDERRALDERSYRALYEKLARVAEVQVLDCGTGLSSPAMHAALACADQLVLVCDGDPDTMNLIAGEQCVSLLRGFPGPVFIVANKMSRGVRARLSLARFERELSFADGIVEVSYEREAAENLPRLSWARQPPDDWAIQLRELAALIAASWDRRK